MSQTEQLFSKKVWMLFMIAPFLPAIPVIGYMEYMINLDQETVSFKEQCINKGGVFNFDIPKILICKDRSELGFTPYVGDIQLTEIGKDTIAK